jgi:hypothetical protein
MSKIIDTPTSEKSQCTPQFRCTCCDGSFPTPPTQFLVTEHYRYYGTEKIDWNIRVSLCANCLTEYGTPEKVFSRPYETAFCIFENTPTAIELKGSGPRDD